MNVFGGPGAEVGDLTEVLGRLRAVVAAADEVLSWFNTAVAPAARAIDPTPHGTTTPRR
jgi:hypothetical protein